MADDNGAESQLEIDHAYEHAQALLKLSSLAVLDGNGLVDTRAILSLATAILTRAHLEAIAKLQKGPDDEIDPRPVKSNL